jgi:hypothetical protein
MSGTLAIIRAGAAQDCRPHPRHLLDRGQWSALAAALASDPGPAPGRKR